MVLMFFFQPLLLKISKHLLNISKDSELNIFHSISVIFDQLKVVKYSWKLLLHFMLSLTSSSFGEISLFEVCGKTAAALFVELTDVEKESVAAIRAAKSFFSDILAWKWPTWKKGWQKTSQSGKKQILQLRWSTVRMKKKCIHKLKPC